jgi:FkbM family methyltransferase
MQYKKLKIEIPESDKGMAGCEDMLASYSGPRRTALDLGAHIGTRSLWLATDGGFESVWAVECAMDNFNLLCKNITSNKLSQIITPALIAVDAGEHLVALRHTGCNYGQRSICYRESAGPRCYYIMTIALDKLIYDIGGPVDFIKMDIEGAEYSIFYEGYIGTRTKNGLSKTSCLFIETHAPNELYYDPQWLEGLGYDPENPNEKLIENIKLCGFKNIEITDIGQIIAMR